MPTCNGRTSNTSNGAFTAFITLTEIYYWLTCGFYYKRFAISSLVYEKFLNIFLTDAFIKSVFHRCNVLWMKYLCSKFRNLIKLYFIQLLFARRTRTEPYDWRSLRRWPFLPQILATTWTLMALPLWCLPNYCLHLLRTQGWHGTTSTNRGKIDWQYCQLYSIFKHVLAIIFYL